MIRVREVSLIGNDGEQLGVFPTQEALNMAEEKDQDLVEVALTAARLSAVSWITVSLSISKVSGHTRPKRSKKLFMSKKSSFDLIQIDMITTSN